MSTRLRLVVNRKSAKALGSHSRTRSCLRADDTID